MRQQSAYPCLLLAQGIEGGINVLLSQAGGAVAALNAARCAECAWQSFSQCVGKSDATGASKQISLQKDA